MIEINSVNEGDCLKLMPLINDQTIDLIIADLPYCITRNSWDQQIIPFTELWIEYRRLIKPGGIIALTASQPFTAQLVCSNIKEFKYEFIWEKSNASNFLNAKKQPLKNHESILIFCPKPPGVYYPQFTEGKPYISKKSSKQNGNYNAYKSYKCINDGSKYYPKSIQKFNVERGLHPTQKPTKLFEYLIKTYTLPGALVLDNVAGAGTTAIACINTDRNYILIEKENKYIEVINQRISDQTIKKAG